MIDIIVLDYDGDITKTLASIYIQTIRDKVNVYLISKSKIDNIEGFKKRLNIKEYYGNNLNSLKKKVLEESHGEYIYTMYSGDVFYDVFALNNVVKYLDNYDAVISKVVNRDIMYVDFVDRGNLYKRSYLKENNILDVDYDKLFVIYSKNYVYAEDLIYVYGLDDKSRGFIDNFIKCIDKVKDICSKESIASVIYDVSLYIAYSNKYKSKAGIKKLLGYYKKYYKYVLESYKVFYSSFYSDDMSKDSVLLDNLFDVN